MMINDKPINKVSKMWPYQLTSVGWCVVKAL